MYVNNGKISTRQTFRLYLFDLMGIATLLLPPYLAKICGTDGVWAILLGTAGGVAYIFYLGWIMKSMQMDAIAYVKNYTSKWFWRIVFGVVWIHSVLTAGFCAYVFGSLMQHTLVKETSFTIILFVLVLMSVYAVSGGIERRARVYEVLFFPVLLPYVAMMLATIKDFESAYVKDLFDLSGVQLAEGSFLVFLFLTPLFYAIFLIAEKEKSYGRNVIKTIFYALILSAVILLLSYVLLIGNFGGQALSKMRFPVVTIMSTIQFNGNFLKRMDALMIGVWFFTLYALLNLHLHYGVRFLTEILNNKKEKNKPIVWQHIAVAACVWGIAYILHQNQQSISWFVNYYAYVTVPVMIMLPFLMLLAGRRRKEERNVLEKET